MGRAAALGFPEQSTSWNWTCSRWGFPGGSDGKESARNVGDLGSIPRLGRSPPGEGNGNPLHYSCLENSMDRGAWRGYSPWSSKESDTSERLSPHWWRSLKLCLWQEMPTRAMRFLSQSGSHVCPMWVSFLRSEPSLGTTENSVRKSRVHYCGTIMLL